MDQYRMLFCYYSVVILLLFFKQNGEQGSDHGWFSNPPVPRMVVFSLGACLTGTWCPVPHPLVQASLQLSHQPHTVMLTFTGAARAEAATNTQSLLVAETAWDEYYGSISPTFVMDPPAKSEPTEEAEECRPETIPKSQSPLGILGALATTESHFVGRLVPWLPPLSSAPGLLRRHWRVSKNQKQKKSETQNENLRFPLRRWTWRGKVDPARSLPLPLRC